MSDPPRQGDVFWADPEPTRGREQAKPRPFVVVSRDLVNAHSGLAIVVPTTRTETSRLHVRIDPPDGGLRERSYAMPEQMRAMSVERFERRLGSLRAPTRQQLLKRCRVLLGDER